MTDQGPVQSAGQVSIVGAGPGSLGCLTLDAVRAITTADVVVCDRLVGAGIRSLIPERATLIDVGKSRGTGPTQQDIIEILVTSARDGRRVVRLKGGDPFVFGRGSEEIDALAAANIATTLIPGLSSVIAAPASAGIPVTRRGIASSVAFATATEIDGPRTDWRALAAADTAIVLMGLDTLQDVVASLIAGGRSPEEPAAAIQDATLSTQRAVHAPLESLYSAVTAAGLRSPVTLITGPTVLADSNAQRPAPIRTALITRPRARTGPLARELSRRQIRSIIDPAIEIVPVDDPSLVDLEGIDAVAFTSMNCVDAFFRALARSGRDTRSLAGLRCFAIGPTTADALRTQGVTADLVALDPSAQGLADALTGGIGALLLPRGDRVNATLAGALESQSWTVIERRAYHVIPRERFSERTLDALRGGVVDVITLASAETALTAAAMFRRHDLDPADIPAVCIGAPTADAATRAGFSVQAIAAQPSASALAAAAASLFAP